LSNPIVNILVSIVSPAAPSNLQRSVAFISQGATNTSQGTLTFLATSSSLTPFLNAAAAISNITWSGSVVTVTTSSPHGFATGAVLWITIAGCTPVAYNGTFLCTVTGTSAFTYALSANPGAESGLGTYALLSVGELTEMNTTYFAQGTGPGAYVLELGANTQATNMTFLASWIAQNPNTVYAFLVPRKWDGASGYLSLVANYNANTAKLYFYTTTTLQNYSLYPTTDKSVVALIEAPAYGTWAANVITSLSQTGGVATADTTTNHGVAVGQWFQLSGNLPSGWNGWFQAQVGTATDVLVFNVPSSLGAETQLGTLVQSQFASTGVPATEFSMAAVLFNEANQNPSGTNKVPPFNQQFVTGVTPFPVPGNASLLTTLFNASINIIGTGAAGGLSNTLIFGGRHMDGNPINFWYSVDWVQINTALNLTNYIINGSNDPVNPVYYNQAGINGGQTVLQATMNSGISYGLVLNNTKVTQLSAAGLAAALDAGTYDNFTLVNADPFISYTTENPSDYAVGKYNGYTIEYVPLRGFDSITINVIVSQFAS
jgi:hypothetical protein